MPRIKPGLLDCVVYIYPSREDAEAGALIGGSGFLASVPPGKEGLPDFLYVVTNHHVVTRPMLVIRLNTNQGDTTLIETTENEWLPHPSGDDVAIFALEPNPAFLKYSAIRRDQFIERKDWADDEQSRLGPGDDTFAVGRLIGHDGKQRNTPVVRFGNLSMMPFEPIRQRGRDFDQESFVVEIRSLGGFSGSPVFVVGLPYGASLGMAPSIMAARFLGITWGHVPDFAEESVAGEGVEELPTSGMIGVVPAWKLSELLDLEEVSEARREREEEHKNNAVGVEDDASSQFDRFKNLSRRIVNIPKEEIKKDADKKGS